VPTDEESEPLGGARTFLNSDPGRAREKAEIYFYFSEGRLGPPPCLHEGARARARARALSTNRKKKFCSQQAASGSKLHRKILFFDFFFFNLSTPFLKMIKIHSKSMFCVSIKDPQKRRFSQILRVWLDL